MISLNCQQQQIGKRVGFILQIFLPKLGLSFRGLPEENFNVPLHFLAISSGATVIVLKKFSSKNTKIVERLLKNREESIENIKITKLKKKFSKFNIDIMLLTTIGSFCLREGTIRLCNKEPLLPQKA